MKKRTLPATAETSPSKCPRPSPQNIELLVSSPHAKKRLSYEAVDDVTNRVSALQTGVRKRLFVPSQSAIMSSSLPYDSIAASCAQSYEDAPPAEVSAPVFEFVLNTAPSQMQNNVMCAILKKLYNLNVNLPESKYIEFANQVTIISVKCTLPYDFNQQLFFTIGWIIDANKNYLDQLQATLSAAERATTAAVDPKPQKSGRLERGPLPVIHPSVFRHYKARDVEGDGHCCIRALSLCLLGSEEWFLGLRLIAIIVFLSDVPKWKMASYFIDDDVSFPERVHRLARYCHFTQSEQDRNVELRDPKKRPLSRSLPLEYWCGGAHLSAIAVGIRRGVLIYHNYEYSDSWYYGKNDNEVCVVNRNRFAFLVFGFAAAISTRQRNPFRVPRSICRR